MRACARARASGSAGAGAFLCKPVPRAHGRSGPDGIIVLCQPSSRVIGTQTRYFILPPPVAFDGGSTGDLSPSVIDLVSSFTSLLAETSTTRIQNSGNSEALHVGLEILQMAAISMRRSSLLPQQRPDPRLPWSWRRLPPRQCGIIEKVPTTAV